MTHHIKKACPQGYLSSLTGDSLEKAWWTNHTPMAKNGYWVEEGRLKPLKVADAKAYPKASSPLWHWDESPKQVQFPRRWYDVCLRMGWSYEQKRRESTSFSLSQNLQGEGNSPERSKSLRFQLAAIFGRNQSWEPHHRYSKGFTVLYEGKIYKCLKPHLSGDLFNLKKWQLLENHVHVDAQAGRATFFPTDRGQQAIAYALEVAKAHLAASARCIQIDLSAPLSELLDVTLDHTLSITDPRLPGGTVKGKVIAYRFVVDGKTGERIAHIRLGVSMGTGMQVIAEMPQSQDYLEPDVWEESISCLDEIHKRSKTGLCFRIDQGEHLMGVCRPLMLSDQDLLEEIEIINDGEQQNRKLAKRQYPHSFDLKAALKEMPTNIRLKLKNLKTYGCLDHHVPVTVLTRWSAPKQIDLSAETNR